MRPLDLNFGYVKLRLWRRCRLTIGWRCWYFPPLPRSWWDDEIDYMKEIGWKGYDAEMEDKRLGIGRYAE